MLREEKNINSMSLQYMYLFFQSVYSNDKIVDITWPFDNGHSKFLQWKLLSLVHFAVRKVINK